jgi:LysR family transcriptional regulator, benzoate and cis,cis-muconate-responsive activator of ben and cat genes
MTSSLNLADVEAFIAVSDMRSIAKASARLHLSQPAITRRVQNLEDQLGVKLFDRDSRPMVLTPEGQEAYKHAKTLLASTAELQAQSRRESEWREISGWALALLWEIRY